MRLRVLAGLIVCNLIWSAHPVLGKLVLRDFLPAHAAWLRYSSALAGYLAAFAILARIRPLRGRLGSPFFRPTRGVHWLLVCALGFLTFCYSPLLTMAGLEKARATDGALIIAMEPLMTVLLASLVLGERFGRRETVAFAGALAGFVLLTGRSPADLARGFDPQMTGNLLLLVSLAGEASYSTIGRQLLKSYRPIPVFGSALLAGVAFLTLATFFYAGLPSIERLSWTSAAGLFWLGPLGTTAAYLFWMLAIAEAPISSAALTLFIQPVLGAAWGMLFLGERLSLAQFGGGALILGSVAAQTYASRYKDPV